MGFLFLGWARFHSLSLSTFNSTYLAETQPRATGSCARMSIGRARRGPIPIRRIVGVSRNTFVEWRVRLDVFCQSPGFGDRAEAIFSLKNGGLPRRAIHMSGVRRVDQRWSFVGRQSRTPVERSLGS